MKIQLKVISAAAALMALSTLPFWASSVQAAPVELQNGLYDAAGVCSEQIMTSPTEILTLADESNAQGTCTSAGTVVTYQRRTDTRFVGGESDVLDSSWLSSCAPKQNSPKPCALQFYDPNTGALLIQLGDVLSVAQTITIIDSTSFKMEPAELTWSRGQNVVKQWQDDTVSADTLYTKSQ